MLITHAFYSLFRLVRKLNASKTSKKTMAGPISVPTTVSSKPFKQPFKAVAALSRKTGELTKPVDPAIEKTLDYLSSGYSVSPMEKVDPSARFGR